VTEQERKVRDFVNQAKEYYWAGFSTKEKPPTFRRLQKYVEKLDGFCEDSDFHWTVERPSETVLALQDLARELGSFRSGQRTVKKEVLLKRVAFEHLLRRIAGLAPAVFGAVPRSKWGQVRQLPLLQTLWSEGRGSIPTLTSALEYISSIAGFVERECGGVPPGTQETLNEELLKTLCLRAEARDSQTDDAKTTAAPEVPRSRGRKPMPNADLESVHRVVKKFGPGWREKIEEVGAALDKKKVPVPPDWKRTRQKAQTWKRGIENYSDRAIKAIDYRLKKATERLGLEPR